VGWGGVVGEGKGPVGVQVRPGYVAAAAGGCVEVGGGGDFVAHCGVWWWEGLGVL
jgi:hypothetical protein